MYKVLNWPSMYRWSTSIFKGNIFREVLASPVDTPLKYSPYNLIVNINSLNWIYCFSFNDMPAGVDIDQNGLDNTNTQTIGGDDSDSLGNSRSKNSITPPAKEKRKPFFKKVR